MNERWRPVTGFDGYEVSDLGRVRSWWQSAKGIGARGRERAEVPHQLRPFKGKRDKEYLSVCLYATAGGKPRNRLVHRLVLEAFIGPCPSGHEARHFPDLSPLNNRLDNLSWATPKTNYEDKARAGTAHRKRGANGRYQRTI
jgi:hypothetical protein